MAAPQFSVNAHRFDPYKNFKFRVKFSDNTDPVAGMSKLSPLKRMTEVVKHREGNDPTAAANRRGTPSTMRLPSSAASPTTRNSRNGRIAFGTTGRVRAPSRLSRTSVAISGSN